MDAAPSPRHAGAARRAVRGCACLHRCPAHRSRPSRTDVSVVRGADRRGGVHRRRDRDRLPAPRRRPGRACAPSPSPSSLVGARRRAVFAITGAVNDSVFVPDVADVVLLGVARPVRPRGACGVPPPISNRAIDERSPPTSCCSPLSLAVIAYVAIRPTGREHAGGVSAGDLRDPRPPRVIAMFGALALWFPDAPATCCGLHGRSRCCSSRPCAFGFAWVARGDHHEAPPWIAIAFAVTPARRSRSSTCWCPHDSGALRADGSTRIARPVLTSITVMTRVRRISIVAILDDATGHRRRRNRRCSSCSSGAAIAVRILVNQLSSAEAFDAGAGPRSSQAAACACADTDAALDRVREANESLAAPKSTCGSSSRPPSTGSSRLDDRRSGPARQRRVRHDGRARSGPRSTGLSWTALAAAIDGADAGFAQLFARRAGDDHPLRRARRCTWRRPPRRSRRDPPRTLVARPRRQRRRRSPIRRSGRCSSSCRTATRTARACSADRTPRSSRSATASRATCTTAPSKASRRRRSRSRRRC